MTFDFFGYLLSFVAGILIYNGNFIQASVLVALSLMFFFVGGKK